MRFRRLHSGRAAALLIALAVMLAAPAFAQNDRPRSNAEVVAALEPLKTSLDAIEAASHGVANDQALAELTQDRAAKTVDWLVARARKRSQPAAG